MAANFRTFGWFGTDCRFGTLQDSDLEMYDFATQTASQKFPLDIAMKIFWEADTITVEAYRGPVFGLPEFTTSMDINWGENRTVQNIDGTESVIQQLRPYLTTAKEAVCILSGINNNFEPLTFKRVDYLFGSRGGTLTFSAFRPYYGRSSTNNTKIYAPFTIEHGDIGGVTSVSNFNLIGNNPLFPNTYGVCFWVTPWGNFETPVRFNTTFPQFVSNFTVTVTAADPNIRYAV
jgi:hypothetical protein